MFAFAAEKMGCYRQDGAFIKGSKIVEYKCQKARVIIQRVDGHSLLGFLF